MADKENINELSNKLARAYADKVRVSGQVAKREKGYRKAVEKLSGLKKPVKEEIEQLDEIGDTIKGQKKLKKLLKRSNQEAENAGLTWRERTSRAKDRKSLGLTSGAKEDQNAADKAHRKLTRHVNTAMNVYTRLRTEEALHEGDGIGIGDFVKLKKPVKGHRYGHVTGIGGHDSLAAGPIPKNPKGSVKMHLHKTPHYGYQPSGGDHEADYNDVKKLDVASRNAEIKKLKEEMLDEGKNYHSVFVKCDDVWCHHFDADNKEDADSEKESIRNQGHRTVSIVTPKGNSAHAWGTDKSKGQTDPHEFVTAHLKAKGLREEDLHELSKKTLNSYVDKSAAEREIKLKAYKKGKTWSDTSAHKQSKRTWGIIRAMDKLHVAEEVENLDEVSSRLVKNYRDVAKLSKSNLQFKSNNLKRNSKSDPNDDIGKTDQKLTRRRKGLDLATDKLHGYAKVNATKEEVEHIHEIGDTEAGQKALRSYVRKSAYDFVKHDSRGEKLMDAGEKYYGAGDKKNGKRAVEAGYKHSYKGITRMIGIQRAGKRIKEEMENIHEVGDTERGRKTLSSYMDKRKSGNQALGFGFNHADHPADDVHVHKKAFAKTQGILRAKSRIEDNTPLQHKPKIHDVSHMSDGEVYDHTQTSGKIKDGDVLHMKGGRSAVMFKAWPTMVHGESDALHSFGPKGAPKSHHEAVKVAKNIGGIIGAKEKNMKEEVEIDEGRTYKADRDSYYASRKRAGAAAALKKSSKTARLARDQKKRAIGEDVRVDADGTTTDTVIKEPVYREALKQAADKLRHNYLVKKQIYRTDD